MFQFIPAILALINLVSGVATVVDVVKTVTKKPEPEPAPEPEPEPEPEPLPEPDDLEISWEPNQKYSPATPATNQKPSTNADLIYLRKKWAQIRQQRQRERQQQQRQRQPQTTYAMISKQVKRKRIKS